MLAIEVTGRTLREFGRLPLVSRAGLLVMAMAAVLDVAVHALDGGHAVGGHPHGLEHAVHLLGVVGMVIVLAGVVMFGARRHLRRYAAESGGHVRDAYR